MFFPCFVIFPATLSPFWQNRSLFYFCVCWKRSRVSVTRWIFSGGKKIRAISWEFPHTHTQIDCVVVVRIGYSCRRLWRTSSISLNVRCHCRDQDRERNPRRRRGEGAYNYQTLHSQITTKTISAFSDVSHFKVSSIVQGNVTRQCPWIPPPPPPAAPLPHIPFF